MSSDQLKLKPVRSLTTPHGFLRTGMSISRRGELLVLEIPVDMKAGVFGKQSPPDKSFFPPSRAESPYGAQLKVITSQSESEYALHDIGVAMPTPELLPGIVPLIVGARTSKEGEVWQANAEVFSPQGRPINRFCLGDGIGRLQVSKVGDIWAGYFDEGVFGDHPYARSGLARFGADGRLIWKFEPPEHAGPVDDCYALNVADDFVWTCYYSTFALVRIAPDSSVRCWPPAVSGAGGLAVLDGTVAFLGSYGGGGFRIRTFELTGDRLAPRRTLDIRASEGRQFNRKSAWFARGSTIHVVEDDLWSCIDLSELV
jgi:hypothetical protein